MSSPRCSWYPKTLFRATNSFRFVAVVMDGRLVDGEDLGTSLESLQVWWAVFGGHVFFNHVEAFAMNQLPAIAELVSYVMHAI